MLGRRFALVLVKTPKTTKTENSADPVETVDVENLILTIERSVLRTAVGIGYTVALVATVKTICHICETIVDSTYK